MIRRTLRKVLRFVESARFATWLLVFVGAWSALASFIPQAGDSSADVGRWVAAHSTLEPVVGALGMHKAFTAPLFMAAVALLGLSTILCAWRRTKVALHRSQALLSARRAERESLLESHDLRVVCDPKMDPAQVSSAATDVLSSLGVELKPRGDVLAAISHPISVWGSPIFHWGLVALVLIILGSGLQRSEGLMGVAVGQTKPDTPASYGKVHAGPLHNWNNTHRAIRVDFFEQNYYTGKIDRGPTPTVSVLNANGDVLKTQRVYPNNPLRLGSLTIHPVEYGLAAKVTLLSASGAEVGQGFQLVDFSTSATSGTDPVGYLIVSKGQTDLQIRITVPLDRQGDTLLKAIPQQPKAQVTVTSPSNETLMETVVAAGNQVVLPLGDSIRLDEITWYARLNIVDDHTITLLYVGMGIAFLGLALTVAMRQQVVLASAVSVPEGTVLVAKVRMWRNATTSRVEMEHALAEALGSKDGEGDA